MSSSRILLPLRLAPSARPGQATSAKVVATICAAVLTLSTALIVTSPSTASAASIVFVSPTGDDTAAGTSQQPVRTAGRAVQLAHSGDTIEFAGGRYHEQLQVYGKALHLRAASGADVVFDGSITVNGWRPSSIVTAVATFEAPWATSFERTGSPFTTPERPEAGWPEMFFADGVPLVEMPSRESVTSGTFFLDVAAGVVVIADDPAQRLIEGSDLNWGLYLNHADGSSVDGLAFRRYATQNRNMAAVRAYSDDLVLSRVTVSDNARIGISAIGSRIVLDGIVATGNGHLGVHAHQASFLTIRNSIVRANNRERFDAFHSAGGIKITSSSDVVVETSSVVANAGPGIWTDLGVTDAVLRSNDVRDNARSGIEIELSDRVLVIDDVVANNGEAGVWVLESSDVQIWNNSVLSNVRDVWIQDGPRDDVDRVVVKNNLLGGDAGAAGVPAILYADDWTGQRSAAVMGIDSDANRFWLVPGARTNAVSRWAQWPAPLVTSSTIEAHRSMTGIDTTSDLVQAATNPFARSAVDPRQPVGAPTGAILAADVAAVVGMAPGSPAPAAGPLTIGRWSAAGTDPSVNPSTGAPPPVVPSTVTPPARPGVPSIPPRVTATPVAVGKVADSFLAPAVRSTNGSLVIRSTAESSEPMGHGWMAFADRVATLGAAVEHAA